MREATSHTKRGTSCSKKNNCTKNLLTEREAAILKLEISQGKKTCWKVRGEFGWMEKKGAGERSRRDRTSPLVIAWIARPNERGVKTRRQSLVHGNASGVLEKKGGWGVC